jgi:hypothetical protein
MANKKSCSNFLNFALGERFSEDAVKIISFRRIFSQGVRYFLLSAVNVRQKTCVVKKNNILRLAIIFN